MKIVFLLCLFWGATLALPPLVQAKLLKSPDVRQSLASAELRTQKFYWDERVQRFAVALTYAAPSHPDQTLYFYFPYIRHEADKDRFIFALGNGRSVVVAYKLAFGDITLERADHLIIDRHYGVVRVSLDIEE